MRCQWILSSPGSIGAKGEGAVAGAGGAYREPASRVTSHTAQQGNICSVIKALASRVCVAPLPLLLLLLNAVL